MKRRIVTRAESLHTKSQTQDGSADSILPTVESTGERALKSKLLDFLASVTDDPNMQIPTTLSIVSEDLPPDTELVARVGGTESEWIVYLPEVRSVALRDFVGTKVSGAIVGREVAENLTMFEGNIQKTKQRMGFAELIFLLNQPVHAIGVVLRNAGLNEEQIQKAYVIFPEIRFRALGIWHTLAIGLKYTGVFEAYAIELREEWTGDHYVLLNT